MPFYNRRKTLDSKRKQSVPIPPAGSKKFGKQNWLTYFSVAFQKSVQKIFAVFCLGYTHAPRKKKVKRKKNIFLIFQFQNNFFLRKLQNANQHELKTIAEVYKKCTIFWYKCYSVLLILWASLKMGHFLWLYGNFTMLCCRVKQKWPWKKFVLESERKGLFLIYERFYKIRLKISFNH